MGSMSSPMLTTVFTNLSHLTPEERHIQPTLALGLYQPFQAQHANQSPLHNLLSADLEQARSIFVTLHMLFPHELLPALDLLDRCLVTKLVVRLTSLPKDVGRAEAPGHPSPSKDEHEVFYVPSASAGDKASSSRYRSRYAKSSVSSTHYEVRLDSWNCSCPAFGVSAFQCLSLDTSTTRDEQKHISPEALNENQPSRDAGWSFGGVASLAACRVPSCKHILAAVLAKAAPKLFKNGFTETVASKEEFMAWGSGWGEFTGG